MENAELPLFNNIVEEPPQASLRQHLPSDKVPAFGRYIVYVDESGDHALSSIDNNYPVFVLAFCIFHKGHYAEKVV